MIYDSAFLATILASSVFVFMVYKNSKKKYVLNGMTFYADKTLDFEKVKKFKPLLDWQVNFHNDLSLKGASIQDINILNVYMFGKNIGFMFMDVNIYYNGKKLPGAVLLRGSSCAVFMWYRDQNDEKYLLLIKQPRVATGKSIWEVPAGCVDGSLNVKGKMFDEIREETGIVPDPEKLNPLDSSFHSSPGLLDEQYAFYELELDISQVQNILKTDTNNLGTNDEVIENVQLFNMKDLPKDDSKLFGVFGYF